MKGSVRTRHGTTTKKPKQSLSDTPSTSNVSASSSFRIMIIKGSHADVLLRLVGLREVFWVLLLSHLIFFLGTGT